MRPEGFNYHTQEISNAVHSMLACASLFKQGGDDNTAALPHFRELYLQISVISIGYNF